MELSPEDALRINVLLAGRLEAVRIDESSMTLHALSGKGEAKVQLNPNCRDEVYLRCVRETLSSHVLGSPGGYPVYLKRWTRMGQARDEILESLLLLGEPEAVVAVVNASGITDELARRAWWALQTAENARCMLRQKAVVDGRMGPVLADFLIEFLPFEEEARDQIASVRLVLQGELIDAQERLRLWEKGRSRNAFYVGFLQALPDDLPVTEAGEHPARGQVYERIAGLVKAGNPYAVQLCRLLSPGGQAFLEIVEKVIRKPANQDVMVELLRAVSDYFATLHLGHDEAWDIDTVAGLTDELIMQHRGLPGKTGRWLRDLIEALPDGMNCIRAMLFLSMIDEAVVNPVFSRTDAIGTVMRKKLQPVTGPIQEQIAILRNS
jgi:hypothetical protein